MSLGSWSNKFGTKDWIYIFIISLFLQFIIYYFSFIYGGSVKALGYISFAGTIISIILAVIAIGYTYGESIKQKTSSDQLLVEIAGLREIKDKLAGQISILENIAEIRTDIKDTREAINKIDFKSYIKMIEGSLSEEKQNVSTSNISFDQIEPIIMDFKMMSDSYILEIMYVLENKNIIDITDILHHIVQFDIENDQWVEVANLYMCIYYMAESIGIFKNAKLQDGIRDIYIKKYPKNTNKFKPDSMLSKIVNKSLYM